MAKEFTLNDWKERIRNGQRFQRRFADSKAWERYKRYYRHQFWGNNKGNSVIPVNLYFSILRSMVPQVYFRNPKVTVTARKPGLEAELNARIVQAIDNWLLGELMVKGEIKKLIQDAFLAGIGNGFLGYDSLYGYDPAKADPASATQFTLTQFDRKGFRTEYNSFVNPGMPWFLRARPDDTIWPWGTESAQNAEWVVMRTFRPLNDVKADPKYTNTSSLQGTRVPIRTGPEGEQLPESHQDHSLDRAGNRQWVEIFQIHDARTGRIQALTMDHDKWIRTPQTDELQIEGLPVETLVFNPDSDFIYGVPDARIIEPQQLELNEIRTQAMKHRRIDIVKFLAKKGVISEEAQQQLTNETVAAVLEAEVDSGLADSIMSFTPGSAGVLQDMALAAETVRQDVREQVGFSRNAQGEFQGKTHISAAETRAVHQSLNIRLDERRDMVADLLTRVVRRFNQIVFTHWDQERVQQIVGPDGAQWWLKYTGTQIRGEYDLNVSPEEGSTLDSTTKFELARQAADSWAQLNQGAIAQGMPVPMEIQRLLFNQFQGSGLDIDKLMAQSQAISTRAQQALGAAGQSQQAPVSPGLLAQALQTGGA